MNRFPFSFPFASVFLRLLLLACLGLSVFGVPPADGRALAGERALKPDEAYSFRWEQFENEAVLIWDITERYYLYDAKFRVLPDEGLTVLSEKKSKFSSIIEDEYFGVQPIHEKRAFIKLVFESDSVAPSLRVEYQGCWKGGICYPLQTKAVVLERPVASGSPTGPIDRKASVLPIAGSDRGAPPPPPLTEEKRLLGLLFEGNPLTLGVVFFLAGVLLSFTPCCLPMVPILSGMILGKGKTVSKGRAFSLSLVFVGCMASAYSSVAVLVGLTGANLRVQLQQPLAVLASSLLFLALAGAMFGFYSFRMPSAVQTWANAFVRRRRGGSFVSVGLMGFVSALVVGPCMVAPLAGVLVYLARTGDAFLGGFALACLSFGMGAPLAAFAVTGSRFLPRQGSWMIEINRFWGFVFVLLAVWMLDRIVEKTFVFPLLATALFVASAYLFRKAFLRRMGFGGMAAVSLTALVFTAYGASLLAGSLTGSLSYLKPLNRTAWFAGDAPVRRAAFQEVFDEKGLDERLAGARRQAKPAVVDFYADWCVVCKEIEHFVFEDAAIAKLLEEAVVIRVNVTEDNEDSRRLMERYGLFGPPALLFFHPSGHYFEELKVNGNIDPEEFVEFYRYAASADTA